MIHDTTYDLAARCLRALWLGGREFSELMERAAHQLDETNWTMLAQLVTAAYRVSGITTTSITREQPVPGSAEITIRTIFDQPLLVERQGTDIIIGGVQLWQAGQLPSGYMSLAGVPDQTGTGIGFVVSLEEYARLIPLGAPPLK